MSICRSCGAPVLFVKTPKGKTQILDAEPHDNGNVQIGHIGGDEVAIVVKDADRAAVQEAGEPLYLDHHASCPQANQWRDNVRRRS